MKVIHIIIMGVIFALSSVAGVCPVRSLPSSEIKNIGTYDEAKAVCTDMMIPVGTELTAENFENSLSEGSDDDILILLVRPTDKLRIDFDYIDQSVNVRKVIKGDPSPEGSEIKISYRGFHTQSYEEFSLSEREGKPYSYYMNSCGLLKPQKEYLVFCRSLTIGGKTVCREASPNFPSFYPVTDSDNEVMILDDGSNDFSKVSEYDIYVPDERQAENWKSLKEYVLDNYYPR